MKRFLCFAVLVALGTMSSSGQSRPNVLLIVTDDQGYGDLSLTGNPILRTPHLDQLAKAGVRFEHFYVSPVCAPTRASLLTGRYHQRTGVWSVTNGFELMDPEETTLAEVLRAAGYRTALFGKWHLGEYAPGLPNTQGFDEYVGFRTGHFDEYFDPVLERNGAPYPTEGYITDVLTDEAIRFIDADANRPFFCYLPYNAPHTPLDVPETDLDRFRDLDLSDRTARVYAMVENIDRNVGRLLRHLDERGLAGETVVLFMSDNGPISGWRPEPEEMRYNAGLRDQKFTIYEGGIRSPLFVRYPKRFEAGSHVTSIAAHIDLLPTVLELTGTPVPDSLNLDGRSLVPLLEGRTESWSDRILFQHYALETLRDPAPYPGGIARTQRFKMVDGTALYDIQNDPGEQHNLVDENPDVLARLDSTYRAWWHEVTAERGFDIRPIPVGLTADPVHLKPHHGRVQGRLEYTGLRGLHAGVQRIGTHPSGVDGDWIANWTSTEDLMRWQIDVTEAGPYAVTLALHVPAEEAGSIVEIRVGEVVLTGEVPVADVPLGTWKPVVFGDVELEAGLQTLTIQANRVMGDQVMTLGEVILTRK